MKRFIDIDPKKIARGVGEIPVAGPEVLRERMEGDFILGAVGTRGARELIRKQLIDYGYIELDDFLFLA